MLKRELLERLAVPMLRTPEYLFDHRDALDELRAVLAQEAGKVEAVAYRYVHDYEHGNGWQRNATDFVEAPHFEDERKDTWRKITPLYTSPPAPVSVVLPEREMYTKYFAGMIPSNAVEVNAYKDGWNACLDKVKELNQ